jgi:tetratricopeptide (TPR) repeat protein
VNEQAVAYWLAAGRQAWARSAVAEAVALLRRGLALAAALPDGDRRRETEFDLLIALSRALTASLSWGAPELAAVTARARQLASALNRPRALWSALLGQYNDTIYGRADLRRAQRLAADMRELGDAAGDVPIQVLGCDAEGFACFNLGEFAAGRANLEKALALYDPADRPFYSELLPNDLLVWLRIRLSLPLACLGYLDQALLQRDAFLGEARRLAHPPTLALALAAAGIAGSFVPLSPESLLRYADELLALATEHGLGHFKQMALIARGWNLGALGRADEGIPLLTAGLAGLRDLGWELWRPWMLTLLGDVCRMAGQWQSALEHLAEARRLAEEREERSFQAAALRLTGEVLLALGDPMAADASYREALALAQQQSAKLWELRAAISLARLWRDQGKRAEARDLLAPVYGWFTEGFDTPVLQDAKALLEKLAA